MIIDRFEGNDAVIEVEQELFIRVPLSVLPKGSREGDVLAFIKCEGTTDQRRRYIEGLMADLWEKPE